MKREPFVRVFLQDLRISGFISLFASIGTFIAIGHDVPVGERLFITILACIIMSLVFSTIISVAQCFVLPYLRFPSFALTVLGVAATYLAIVMIAIPSGILLIVSLSTRTPPWSHVPVEAVKTVLNPLTLGGAFAIMVAITFYTMLSKKLGPGVIPAWIMGKYYRPREEDRIFMFLDLRDSTTLAEQMGNMKFSRLIQCFFEDITEPVLSTKGEVSHYIGDEAVLTWKNANGLKNGNVLKCFFGIQDVIAARSSEYLKEFGMVPGFKAGAHLGTVVATQVGEIKSEIVFHGDVLNTTARIQGLCNDIGSDFLVSKDLANAMGPVPGITMDPVGARELKGKEAAVELLAVSRA